MKTIIYIENIRATGSYNTPDVILGDERDKIIAQDVDELLNNERWVAEILDNGYDALEMYKAFTDKAKQDEIYSYLMKEARECAEDDFDERWFRTETEI